MLRKHVAALTLGVGLVAAASTADARPLSLDELYTFGQHLGCVERCPEVDAQSTYNDHVARQGCLADCGYAPRLWEKNGIPPVDRADHELALLEYYDSQDPTQSLVCYADADETVVMPAAICAGAVCEAAPECSDDECAAPLDVELTCVDDMPGGPRCIWPDAKRPAHCPDVVCDAAPVHSFQECADGDGDGLPAWLEEHLGLDDGAVEDRCGSAQVCRFDQTCAYQPQLGAGLCQDRACPSGACTAFHLELVAQDDLEVIVHVHYDFTPIPARALDLYLDYDQRALTLADARPLKPLLLQGKELASTHLSDGTLRLSVYDTGSSHPIPTGPIVELVFLRTGDGETTIAFSDDDVHQAASVAPLQGDRAGQDQLQDDDLWGAPVTLAPRDEAATTLRAWFGFDSLDSPVTYLGVPDAEALCARYPACANEPDEVERAKTLTRLAALQAGSVTASELTEGVTNSAAYLDGSGDHVRLPIHYEEPLATSAQSYSFSTWFYTEGNTTDELRTTPQVLYAHAGSNERTRFGLMLATSPDGGVDLSLFDGDLLSQSPVPLRVPIATSVPLRTWHHVGFALDADANTIDLYFDGERAGSYTFPRTPAVVCPQMFGGVDVIPHVEGAVLGGRTPEAVYYAASRSNLYRIERMDQSGLGATTVIGDGQYSYRDPDYQPGLDRLVYSANPSGDFEIWVSHGDGSGRQQLTVGFGDADRGFVARRPRWAPDGSGIVFESNAFDVLAQDNTFKRVTHLYYIAWDAVANVPAIELPDGSAAEALEYDALLANQTVSTFRLTSAEQDRHHKNARWLRGKGENQSRGELLFDASSPSFDGHRVARLTIPHVIDLATVEDVTGLGSPEHELRLLAAHHSEKAGLVPVVSELLFYERELAQYDPATDFAVTYTTDSGGATVHVDFAPAPRPADCWDRNRDHLQDSDEDRNGDGAWDTADCLDHQVRNLYVAYDSAVYTALIEDADGQPKTPGHVVVDQNKRLRLKAVEAFGSSYVRVEVLSPLDATPLVPGELATLRFTKNTSEQASVPFRPFARAAQVEQLVKDLTSTAPATPFTAAGLYEQIDDAVFSPRGETLLLAAVSSSRPIILRTETLLGAAGAASLLVEPTRLSGLDWVREERYSPCEWAGGVQHLQTKQILSGLRGGLDDMKVFGGLRDPDAFRSEAERGHELLDHVGLGGELASRLPSCGNNHAECPPYHLCVASECVTVPCDPEDPYSCSDTQSRCTLRPLSVEQENAGPGGDTSAFDWVCAADCNVDAQCFSEACLNGPCRFCAPVEHTCIECRDVVKDLGALTIATTEGCPDTKSFACVSGACETECYSFEDGESVYLCDPLLEYCDHGRCVMHDWSWWDFAPASFQGTGNTRYEVPPDPQNGWPGYAQTVDQRVAVSISAYGVGDYGQAPELVVEARGGPFYGSDWARIARVMVHNTTAVEATANPYVVTSPHPFNDLRMRLITSPYADLTGAATGLREHDDQFCLADFAATAAAAGDPDAAPDACFYQAQGSRYTVGYRVDLPAHEAIAACRERGHSGCPTISQGEHDFLWGGQPAVAVLGVQVDGAEVTNNITADRVCSYEGGMIPVDDDVQKKIFYGDISRERSNERDAFCAADPDACSAPTGLVEFDRETYGFALLNCNVYEPAAGQGAEILFQNIIILRDWPLEQGAVMETANGCTVDVDAFRVEPCFTWSGGDSSVDPNNGAVTAGASIVFASFEFGSFKTFGHDWGFTSVELPRAPLGVSVDGYTGDGLQVCWKDSLGALAETVDVPDGATEVVFPTELRLGTRFEVVISRQPSDPNHVCQIASGARGSMLESGVTVAVSCAQAHPVNVAVQGLSGSVTLENTYSLAAGLPVLGVDELVATADGVVSFGHALPVGAHYEVAIIRQPAGQLCALTGGSGDIGNGAAGMVLVCRDVVSAPLQVAVVGLEGEGLELIERQTGRMVAPSAEGTVAFPGLFIEAEPFDIGVIAQPTGPAQLCRVTSGGAGTMTVGTTEPTVGATVTCDTLPTYLVAGQVIGLRGEGLVLRMGAELLEVAPPAAAGQSVDFAFSAELLAEAGYQVTVASPPQNPDQVCEVVLGEGVVHGDVDDVLVVCQPPNPTTESYTVGGTVTGLTGSGLRLALNGGVEQLVVEANGVFTFGSPFAPFRDYEVVVDRQPSAPTQVCRVDHGVGTVAHADVTNLVVVCVPAMNVTVEVHSSAANGAHVKALLVSTSTNGGARRLVARSPDNVRIIDGRAVFVLDEVASDADAAVLPGRYQLFTYVNTDLDYDGDTGAPHFEPVNDYGAVTFVEGTSSAPPTVVLNNGSFSPLSYGRVTVLSEQLPEDASVRCWFAAAGTGTLLVPPAADAPVLGASSFTCPIGGDPCVDDSGSTPSLTTDRYEPLPASVSYDVTCWVDADDDNTVTGGDLFGAMSGVPAAAPVLMTLTAETF